MEVQINLDVPFVFTAGQRLRPFQLYGDLILAADPGKTNMAIVVGTTFGTQLCVLQFRAPGAAYPTSEYCHDFKDFLTRYFIGSHFVFFGIEQAISKKGMNHHHSSMVLTEIRANLIDLAFQLTGNKPVEMNNWSWKHAILPEGMRTQSEKGSAHFLNHVYQRYGNADVTDAICMYRYLMQKYGCVDSMIVPKKVEQPLAPYQVYIVAPGCEATKRARRFCYEKGLALEENCAYYANRTWERGVTSVTADALTLQDIYKYAVGFLAVPASPMVEVVVVRS